MLSRNSASLPEKKNRVNDSEIKFSYLVTIGAKAVFNCYFHASFDFYCTSIISSIRPYRTERSAVLSMDIIFGNMSVLFHEIPFENIGEVKTVAH